MVGEMQKICTGLASLPNSSHQLGLAIPFLNAWNSPVYILEFLQLGILHLLVCPEPFPLYIAMKYPLPVQKLFTKN